MKKTLFFLAVSMLLLSCGNSKKPPEDSAVKWNPGDIRGNVKSIIATSYQLTSYNSDVNQPEATDVVLQVYNTKGELSESRWYDKDSTLMQRMLFEYDINGSLIRSDYIDYQRELRQVDSSYFLYTYNNNKKLIKEENHHNGEILRWSETEYNDSNDITLHKSYQDGQQLNQTTYEYAYNNDGRKVEEKTYNNGKLTLTMQWTYDDKGRTTAVKTKDGEVSFTESYLYDNKNRLIEESLTPDGSGMKRITRYQYDENDNMVEYIQETEEGNILRCCSYTYDKQGNWIHSVEQIGSSHIVCKRKIEYH